MGSGVVERGWFSTREMGGGGGRWWRGDGLVQERWVVVVVEGGGGEGSGGEGSGGEGRLVLIKSINPCPETFFSCPVLPWQPNY